MIQSLIHRQVHFPGLLEGDIWAMGPRISLFLSPGGCSLLPGGLTVKNFSPDGRGGKNQGGN